METEASKGSRFLTWARGYTTMWSKRIAAGSQAVGRATSDVYRATSASYTAWRDKHRATHGSVGEQIAWSLRGAGDETVNRPGHPTRGILRIFGWASRRAHVAAARAAIALPTAEQAIAAFEAEKERSENECQALKTVRDDSSERLEITKKSKPQPEYGKQFGWLSKPLVVVIVFAAFMVLDFIFLLGPLTFFLQDLQVGNPNDGVVTLLERAASTFPYVASILISLLFGALAMLVGTLIWSAIEREGMLNTAAVGLLAVVLFSAGVAVLVGINGFRNASQAEQSGLAAQLKKTAAGTAQTSNSNAQAFGLAKPAHSVTAKAAQKPVVSGKSVPSTDLATTATGTGTGHNLILELSILMFFFASVIGALHHAGRITNAEEMKAHRVEYKAKKRDLKRDHKALEVAQQKNTELGEKGIAILAAPDTHHREIAAARNRFEAEYQEEVGIVEADLVRLSSAANSPMPDVIGLPVPDPQAFQDQVLGRQPTAPVAAPDTVPPAQEATATPPPESPPVDRPDPANPQPSPQPVADEPISEPVGSEPVSQSNPDGPSTATTPARRATRGQRRGSAKKRFANRRPQ